MTAQALLVGLCAALALLAVYLVTDAALTLPSSLDDFRPRLGSHVSVSESSTRATSAFAGGEATTFRRSLPSMDSTSPCRAWGGGKSREAENTASAGARTVNRGSRS